MGAGLFIFLFFRFVAIFAGVHYRGFLEVQDKGVDGALAAAVGDVVDAKTPSGIIQFKVLEISL